MIALKFYWMIKCACYINNYKLLIVKVKMKWVEFILTEIESSSIQPFLKDANERCGFYFVENGVLVKPSVTLGTIEGDRLTCDAPFNLYFLIQWHTHPISELYYPSLEDLMNLHQYRRLSIADTIIDDTLRVSIIYTVYGIWILQQTHETPFVLTDAKQQMYYLVSSILYSLCNPILVNADKVVNHTNIKYKGSSMTSLSISFMNNFFIPFLFNEFHLRARFVSYGDNISIRMNINYSELYLTSEPRTLVQVEPKRALLYIPQREIMFTYYIVSDEIILVKKEGRKRRSKRSRLLAKKSIKNKNKK